MVKKVLITAIIVGVASFFVPLHVYWRNAIREALLEFVHNKGLSLGSPHGKLFTKGDLNTFKGKDGGPVYLSILGNVFDVSKGSKHYGEGGGYSFFAGKDGTRAFVSGDFTDKGLIEDVDGLSHDDIRGLQDWLNFYHKDYIFVGKLIGHFYDENGEPTANYHTFQKLLDEAQKDKNRKDKLLEMFPPCNSESIQGQKSRVWCTTRSGGIKREWTGVPRQYYQPGSLVFRCACVKQSGPPSDGSDPKSNRGDLDNPQMKLYPGCDPLSVSCDL